MIKTSVIMNSFNRSALLDRGLYSIFSQDYPKDMYEVICVDDSSQDNTQEIALKYIKQNEPLIYIYRDKGDLKNTYTNAAFCANIGIKNSKGEIIIRCDAEIIHDKESIKKLTDVHQLQDNLICFATTYAIPYGSDLMLAIDDYDWKNDREVFLREKKDTLSTYVGRVCLRPLVFLASLKKKHWIGMNGYDEDFNSYGYEDNDMADRWLKMGLEYRFLDKEILKKTGYDKQNILDDIYEPYCCISYHQGHESFGQTMPYLLDNRSENTWQKKQEQFKKGLIGYKRNLNKNWGVLKKGFKIFKENGKIYKQNIENDIVVSIKEI